MVIPNLSPTGGGASRNRAMDQWKGAPKPTTPANKPASGCCTAKPAQSQPASMSKQTSTTTKKPTSKK